MVEYRRVREPGGTYFCTVVLRDRRSDLLVRHVGLLGHTMRAVREARPFAVEAIVVLPEHLHIMMTLPPGDSDYSGRWKAIKSHFSRTLVRVGATRSGAVGKGCSVWQRRFWEHTVRDADDHAHHLDYIHYNPVKHGLVARPVDWPYSSVHRFIRQGILEPDWCCAPESAIEFGERT